MHRPRLFSPFSCLNATQFLGALNDNIFKLVIVFLLIGVKGKESSNEILALSGGIYVLPFLLFSIPAGTLADRFSKSAITVATKIFEVFSMSLGVLAFTAESVWGSYTVLFLMATQSAIFGPSKYGLVPELVRRDQIARANGILTALTVFSIILGTFLASAMTQITGKNFTLIALFCVFISFIGLLTSFGIGRTPKVGVRRRIHPLLLPDVTRVLIRAHHENYLLAAIMGSSYFYLVGAFTQLNTITYAMQSLHLTDVEGGYLFLTAAAGIGVGAFLAGRLCGRQVELGISPLSGFGLVFFFLALWLWDFHWASAIVWLSLLGLFGGIFLVPFDAYLQAASPDRERGENVAAGNFLSFVGVLIASGLLYLSGTLLHLTASQGFLVISLLSFLVILGESWRLRDTYVRLASRWLYRKQEKEEIYGHEKIPYDKPSIYLTHGLAWPAALLIMTTLQQRYMRFLIEGKAPTDLLQRILVFFAKAEFFEQNGFATNRAAQKGRHWLKRGYSLSLLLQDPADRPALIEVVKSLRPEREIEIVHTQLTPSFAERDKEEEWVPQHVRIDINAPY